MLSKDRTCEWLAAEILEARHELKYWLWAYVFMPNHAEYWCHGFGVFDEAVLISVDGGMREKSSP